MIWRVGCCLPGGKHSYRVFEVELEALKFAAIMKRRGDRKVFFWEM